MILGDKFIGELENRLWEAPDFKSSVALIESYLFQRLKNFESHNFNRMLAAIQTANMLTDARVTSLSDASCLSKKQFTRIFSDYVGANPKDFLRVVRFQRALFVMQTNPTMSLTQLAFEAGYYDQPHLIKEFKSFTGYTPTDYLAICAPYSDYFF